jgi:eukaryotic-like serine/threonine-protein kinase
MNEEVNGQNPFEHHLKNVLANYYEAAANGCAPDRRILLDRNPEFATDLIDFFTFQDRVRHLTEPLPATIWQPADNAEAPRQPDGKSGPVRFVDSNPFYPFSEADGQFGDYQLLSLIARGGMGVVFRARQHSLNRLVAVKVIRDGARASAVDARRFRNEAEAVAQLDHPHIVPIHEVGERNGCSYFSMKLLGGGNLAERLAEFTRDPRASARLMSAVARAVQHAHERGILHRDLKPSNILLDDRGDPLVADFGLARWLEGDCELTETGTVLGSPAYMAPEQASGRKGSVTTATDVHGLGAVLYAILAGRPPFRGVSPLEALDRVRGQAPDPPRMIRPSTDRDLETICLKCLEKDPQQRYDSALAVAEDLERWLAGRPILARQAGRAERAWRCCRRNPWVSALMAAVILLVSTSGLGFFMVNSRNRAVVRSNQVVRNQQRTIRGQQYVRHLKLAGQLWANNRPGEALTLLERYLPTPDDDDLRHYPWHYIHRLCTVGTPPLLGHRGDVYFAAFAPNGKTLATAGKDRTVRLWDVATQTTHMTLIGHTDEVNWVAFSSDGKRLASAGDDGTARIWDLAAGRVIAILSGDRDEVLAAVFTPDGRQLITCSRNGTLWFWDAATYKQCRSFAVSNGRLQSLAVSPDGVTLAIGGDSLVIWDSVKQRELRRLHSGEGQFNSVAFSHDGRSLAAGLYGRVFLCDPSNGTITNTFSGDVGAVESVAFSHDDRLLASVGSGGVIHMWDRATGAPDQIASGQARLWCITFSPDGPGFATTSVDETIKLWNAVANRAWIPIPSPSASVNNLSMAFSTEGSKFAVSLRGNVWTYETRTGRPLSKTRLDPGRPIFCTALSSDAALLAMSDEIGNISLWDLSSNRRLREFQAPRVHWATSFSISRCGKWVAGISSDKQTFILDTADGTLRQFGEDMGRRLAVFADGECTIWGEGALRPFLWDPVSNRTRTASQLGHKNSIHDLASSPDGKILATASADRTVILWDRKSLECLSQLYGHTGDVASVAFSPDGRTLATGGHDRLVRLWDLASGVEIASLGGHTGPVAYLLFSPDGLTLASAATKGEGFEVMLRPAWPIEYAPKLSP